MARIDLHTHSVASPDGGLNEAHYKKLLDTGLEAVAVTDHDRIDFAQNLHKKLGNKIIIGQEVTTLDGEIIGLYLSEAVPAGLSALEAAKAIKSQNGLVYVPHPFETVRKGLSLEALNSIADQVDIVEVYNGRAALQNKSSRALDWAAKHHKVGSAGSDAHGRRGWGRTYSVVAEEPSRNNLVQLLASASYKVRSPGLAGVLYPKLNRLRKSLKNAT